MWLCAWCGGCGVGRGFCLAFTQVVGLFAFLSERNWGGGEGICHRDRMHFKSTDEMDEVGRGDFLCLKGGGKHLVIISRSHFHEL